MKILTIAIPSYNAKPYLERCLKSFLIPEIMQDLEIIVVNDGSTDSTPGIASLFVERYPGTFRLINQVNGGHGSAVNTGIQQAEGKYFRVVDADDWVDGKELAKLVGKLRDMDVDIVSTHYSRVDMNSGASHAVCETGIAFDKIYSFDELPINNRYFTLASSTYRTTMLKSLPLRFLEKTFYVDVEYIIIPIPKVKSVIFFDLTIYKYFVGNENQSINLNNMVSRYDHHDRVVRRMISYIQDTPMSEQQLAYCRETITKVMITHYALGFQYDSNKQRGQNRAIEFDKWLQVTDPYLYRLVTLRYPRLKLLRKHAFNHEKIEGNKLYRVMFFAKRVADKGIRLWRRYV